MMGCNPPVELLAAGVGFFAVGTTSYRLRLGGIGHPQGGLVDFRSF